jgi:3-oxoadipate enol-lactonase
MTAVDGGTGSLDWKAAGEGDGLLLLHSLGTDRALWDGQMAALSASHRVVTLDLPGHGSSTARPGPYTMADLTADCLAVADAAGCHTFAVCGMSLGAMIALSLAVAAPQRITALVASNAAPRIGSPELWEQRIAAVADGGTAAIRDTVVPRFVTADYPRLHPEGYEALLATFTDVDDDGYAGCCAALRDSDLGPVLGTIACPTLLVGGDQDVATPPEQMKLLQEAIGHSELVIIPGAGHLPNLDRPLEFTEIVAGFLG